MNFPNVFFGQTFNSRKSRFTYSLFLSWLTCKHHHPRHHSCMYYCKYLLDIFGPQRCRQSWECSSERLNPVFRISFAPSSGVLRPEVFFLRRETLPILSELDHHRCQVSSHSTARKAMMNKNLWKINSFIFLDVQLFSIIYNLWIFLCMYLKAFGLCCDVFMYSTLR